MTETTERSTTGTDRRGTDTQARRGQETRGESQGRTPESQGRTTIADSVVEKIAGMATREVPGIHNLGTGMARTVGGVRERVSGGSPSVTRGVKVEVGERQTAVDLDVVVDYGVPIVDVAGDVRANVISAVERMTGLEVVEVNIAVDDVDLPGDEEGEGPQDRVS